MDAESKCPVMHGANTKNKGEGTTNRDWWPNQLDISILHQHDQKSNPMGENFDYREHFKNIGLENIKDLNQKFDAITCLWNVFGHVSTNEKRLNILKDIKKKLNPKGYLIFDVNNRHNAKQYGIIKIIYRVLVDKFFFNEKRGDAKYEIVQENKKVKGYGHLFTIGEIELLIKKSNFQLKKVYFVNYSNGKVEKTPFFGQILVILEANN